MSRNIHPISPFVTYCQKVIPLAFDESLSYYEALCALVHYLKKEVIPAVNENADAVTELQNNFVILQNYVDNYFKNLDVQEEINNKLDEMAESGALADIIAQYLTLAGVLAYDTIAQLSQATNVASGSKAMTYGYLRLGDGVYNIYKIREITNTDIVDGYNIVAIETSDNLVAERLQNGKEIVIKVTPEDDLQTYLNVEGKKTIILPANTTITATDVLRINSNTELDLNGSTVHFNYARPASFPLVDWDETLGFVTFSANDTFTAYNGEKNIIIKNGIVKGGCSTFMHSAGITIENVEFTTIQSRHAMQFASCKDVEIRKCVFNGTLHQDGVEHSAECINIDPCNYGGQPWLAQDSVMYDHTMNKFFTITENKFNKPTLSGQLYACGVGSHGADESGSTICENITITKNAFGEPYSDAINVCDYKEVTISENSVTFPQVHHQYTYFVHCRGGLENIIINNNIVKNVGQFMYTDSSQRNRKNVMIEGNKIKATDLSGYAVIQLFHFADVYVQNNVIECSYRAFHSDALYSGGALIPNTTCSNVEFKYNEITTTGGGDVFLRFQQTIGCQIIGNTINYLGANNMAWEYTLALQTGTTNAIVMHNTTSDPKHFVNTASVTDKFMYNNAQHRLSNVSGTSQNGSLSAPLTNFTKLVLPLGSTSNTQFVELLPWVPTNRNKFYWGEDTSRVYKFAVVTDGGTVGKGTLTINSDNTYTYSGDLTLRGIYAYD